MVEDAALAHGILQQPHVEDAGGGFALHPHALVVGVGEDLAQPQVDGLQQRGLRLRQGQPVLRFAAVAADEPGDVFHAGQVPQVAQLPAGEDDHLGAGQRGQARHQLEVAFAGAHGHRVVVEIRQGAVEVERDQNGVGRGDGVDGGLGR